MEDRRRSSEQLRNTKEKVRRPISFLKQDLEIVCLDLSFGPSLLRQNTLIAIIDGVNPMLCRQLIQKAKEKGAGRGAVGMGNLEQK